jgi:hypothetical protein
MRQAVEAEDADRAARGEPALAGRERDRFLKHLSRARRAERRRLAGGG